MKGGITMPITWKKEYAFGRLEQFQQIAPDIYMQRRNERYIPPSEEGGEGTWEYESRKISKAQYETYMELLNSPSHEQMMVDLSQMTTGQEKIDGQSLVTMAAIADLYELLTINLLNK